jgi:hypothetical protein
MAAGQFTLFDSFIPNVGEGLIDLDNDTFKLAILGSGYAPSAGHNVLADVSGNEIAAGNGYTAGGATLPSVSWTYVGNRATFDSGDAVFTAAGGALTGHYAVIYDDTAAGKPLVGYYLLDEGDLDVSVNDGGSITCGPNGASGWFELESNAA